MRIKKKAINSSVLNFSISTIPFKFNLLMYNKLSFIINSSAGINIAKLKPSNATPKNKFSYFSSSEEK